MCMYVREMQEKIQSDTCRYALQNTDISIHMCMYVPVCKQHAGKYALDTASKWKQIHTDTYGYSFVCIQYRPCICDMDCLISRAYVRAYVCCMCLKYIHIYQSICVLYVLQIHAHMHWQDHWWIRPVLSGCQAGGNSFMNVGNTVGAGTVDVLDPSAF